MTECSIVAFDIVRFIGEIILFKMAMRSALSRGIVTRSMDSTSRGASSRFFSGKGKVLSEEEQAKENVYIQKWERERLEKQKLAGDKGKAEKPTDNADNKKPDGTQKN